MCKGGAPCEAKRTRRGFRGALHSISWKIEDFESKFTNLAEELRFKFIRKKTISLFKKVL